MRLLGIALLIIAAFLFAYLAFYEPPTTRAPEGGDWVPGPNALDSDDTGGEPPPSANGDDPLEPARRNAADWATELPAPVLPAEADREGRPETFESTATGSVLALVPAGTFIRGSEESRHQGQERPLQRIFISAFYMDRHAITNEQFEAFIDAGGYTEEEYWSREGWATRSAPGVDWLMPGGWDDEPMLHGPDQPVVGISWFEAEAFANWRSLQDGFARGAGYRLPRECEWEKAARGTDGRRYPWGEEFDPQALNWGDGEGRRRGVVDDFAYTAPVTAFAESASPYGMVQMVGNVREWCEDWHDYYYFFHEVDPDPELWWDPFNTNGDLRPAKRVLRGGSYLDDANGGPFECSMRMANYAATQELSVGFRLVLPARVVDEDH